ncbi:E3 ubiquitin-protein ligase makorin-1, partial [Armadillidium nasatum]
MTIYPTLDKLSLSSDNISPDSPSKKDTSSKNLKSEKQKLTLTTHKSKSAAANSSLCVDAPEFVPQAAKDPNNSSQVTAALSFAQVVGDEMSSASKQDSKQTYDPYSDLCPYYLFSETCQLEKCTYIHGMLCDICQLHCLHPYDEEQRSLHTRECTQIMEAEMEHSFAVARSSEKVCGICMDTVMERSMPSQRRFGILPNCSHCFCLDCLRKWRKSKQFENKIIRACPECRVQSDYVIPSRYWVDDKDKEEKEKLVESYKDALSLVSTSNKGKVSVLLETNASTFTLYLMGTRKDVGPPKRKRRFDAEGELQVYLDHMVLWDFIEEREHRLELIRGSIRHILMELELDDLAEDLYFPDDSGSTNI